MRIRSHLLLLAAGAMLPVLGFAVLVSAVLLNQVREGVERGARDRARAMITAVDAELHGTIATMEALAAAHALADDDVPRFRIAAARVLATQPAWTNVTLLRPSGERLVEVWPSSAGPRARVVDAASVARVVQTAMPAIGSMDATDPAGDGIPIRVPVVRDGAVAYVLTAVVRPDSFVELLQRQKLPEGWIAGVVDANGRYVARLPMRPTGDLASVDFRNAVKATPEGWTRGRTVEGRDVYAAHATSGDSRWSVGIAIPAELVLADVRAALLLIGVGVLGSIATAAAMTIVSGRRIARPIVSLATVARSIGSGTSAVIPVRGDVEEVTEVGAALREADTAVRERQSMVQRERDALRSADEIKDQFIAALSHELRNPLAALSAASHVLRVAQPGHTAAIDAREVIERQTRMIEDLLDVSRIIMGKATLTPETFDLGQLATDTVSAWERGGRFGTRDVVVQVQPAWISADRLRIEQILNNLLDNAVKFTSETATITVTVGEEVGVAVLTVGDDGPGIAPALKARVFELFVQGEQGAGRVKGGIGLGLALVKRLTELHAGTVDLATGSDGAGAVFVVRLPAVSNPTPAFVVVDAVEAQHAAPCKILIVEDNRDARDMLRDILEMAGHDVLDAPDGSTAVKLAIETRPDVAIVDIGLPDITGYEVARRMRAALADEVTIVALTGYGQARDIQHALEAGFDVHLVKPVALERLDEAIGRADIRRAVAGVRAGN
jgi:signal transduction histidine kinase/ActR/RegA family two-component response regulator